jgi:hypothetical protein
VIFLKVQNKVLWVFNEIIYFCKLDFPSLDKFDLWVPFLFLNFLKILLSINVPLSSHEEVLRIQLLMNEEDHLMENSSGFISVFNDFIKNSSQFGLALCNYFIIFHFLTNLDSLCIAIDCSVSILHVEYDLRRNGLLQCDLSFFYKSKCLNTLLSILQSVLEFFMIG